MTGKGLFSDELSFDHKLARPTDGWTGLLKKGVELTWTGIEFEFPNVVEGYT